MDAGDILSQKQLPIEPSDTVGSLFEKLSLIRKRLIDGHAPEIIQ